MTDVPAWQMPREPHAVDYGSFSVLAGALAEEMQRRQGVTGNNSLPSSSSSVSGNGTPVINDKTDQEMTLELIRASLDCEKAAKSMNVDESSGTGPGTVGTATNGNSNTNATNSIMSGYWTTKRAAEGEAYVRDLVYGGIDGLAYVRSLAEFVDGNTYCKSEV